MSEPKRRRIVRKNIGSDKTKAPVEYSKEPIDIEPCGTIERIVLKNVFCHEHLDFSGFKLNINLLQGSNGSGKSSIVAAIIAGLGGSSRNTDRAENLKSIIQNGKSSASIAIHLKNKGPLSYKNEEFGDTIIIERKIVASGSSTYKLMDEGGATVSTKKDDLKKILDSFNLQVDNPVLILSQERAKSFLSGTKPGDLFEFFMRATQLRQWKDDYEFKKTKSHELRKVVENKEQDIKQLGKEIQKWEKKVQAIRGLQEKRNMLSDLRKAMAWAEVKELEDELRVLQASQTKNDAKLNQVADAMKKVENKRNEFRKQRKSFDEEVVETSKSIKHWESEWTKRSAVVAEAKKKHRSHVNERNALERERIEREQDVLILTEKLQQDNDEVTAQWQAKVKELNEKKEAQILKALKLEEAIGNEQEDIKKISSNLREWEDEYYHCELQTKAIKSRQDALERELKGIQEGGKDCLTVFGQFMPALVREVEIANKRGLFRAKPIGPLGAHIKVRDVGSAWMHIVESVTRGILHSFLVSCSADAKQLSKIFDKVIQQRGRRPQIITSPFRNKLHDFTRFETVFPPYFSLWSVLDVENIQVANTLLDQLQLESILLIPTADEAANLLVEARNVPQNCHKGMTLHGDTYFPDPNYRIYSGKGDKSVRFLQVSVDDKIRDLHLNLESTRYEVQNSQTEIMEKSHRAQQAKAMKDKASRKLDALQKELHSVKRQIQELKNSDPPPPTDVAQLRSDLEENKGLKMQVENKIQQLFKDIEVGKRDLIEKSEHLQEALAECEKIRAILQDHETNTSSLDDELLKKEKEIKVLKETTSKFLGVQDRIQKEIDTKTAHVNAKETEILKVYPERIEPKKSKREFQIEYAAMETAIEREEAVHGSLEEIKSTWEMYSKKHEKMKKEVKVNHNFVLEWERMLNSREQKYRQLKHMLKCYVSSSFVNLINKRKLVGRLVIDFKEKSLKIMMKKDTGDESHQLQSLAMMSGGERSYATVSFILALWDVVCSPLKIMDEFEIFMDVVSRSQCMQMIIESAKSNKQYILVSPLENKAKSEKLHVFRMPDPDRSRPGDNQESEEI